MENISNILFPVDLSDTSTKIVPYVKQMAEKFDSKIHLLLVVRVLEHYSVMYVNTPQIVNFQTEVLDGAKKRLLEFRDEFFFTFSDVKVTAICGDISEEILNYVKVEKINLLILGTHGRKGLEKIFFGSIAERVAKTAPVPVLLINQYKIQQNIDKEQAQEFKNSMR